MLVGDAALDREKHGGDDAANRVGDSCRMRQWWTSKSGSAVCGKRMKRRAWCWHSGWRWDVAQWGSVRFSGRPYELVSRHE